MVTEIPVMPPTDVKLTEEIKNKFQYVLLVGSFNNNTGLLFVLVSWYTLYSVRAF